MTTLTKADGLLHNDVIAVADARDGGVWIGTKAGVQLLTCFGF